MSEIADVAILCGGRGTRLQEHTQSIPKPLVEIGGEPIVWHVIQIYAAQGLRRFWLCTGYKGDLIEEYVASQEWPRGRRGALRRHRRGHPHRRPHPPGRRAARRAALLRDLRGRRGRHRHRAR